MDRDPSAAVAARAAAAALSGPAEESLADLRTGGSEATWGMQVALSPVTSASGVGVATIAADGTVLDTWFPAPELSAATVHPARTGSPWPR